MFDYHITKKFQVNLAPLETPSTETSDKSNQDWIMSYSDGENSTWAITHNDSARPLTPEEQAIKNSARQAQLDEISAMKAQAQKSAQRLFLPQTLTIVRDDGLKLELVDSYDKEISNMQDDFSDIHPSVKLVVTNKNNEKHEISVLLSEDMDIVDVRRMKDNIGKFLAELSEEKITELTNKNITHINFYAEENNDTYIGEDYVEVSSASFILPKRDYKTDFNFSREDGCKFEIKGDGEASSTLTITTPNKQVLTFKLEGADTDKYHQWQLPKFKKLLNEIPLNVLQDLSQEVDSIRFMDKNYGASGVYPLGSNTIALTVDTSYKTYPVSLVHELGHALDDRNGAMISKSPEFTNKFEQFKALAQKFGIDEYSLTNAQEFFASTYAYLSTEDDSSGNHILELDKKMEKIKASSDPEAKQCCELLEELKQDVQNLVSSTRTQPKEKRADNKIKDLVQKECADIITQSDKFQYYANTLVGQSTELELIQILSYEDKDFEAAIKNYEQRIKDNRDPVEVQQLFTKMITKLRELRAVLKSGQ